MEIPESINKLITETKADQFIDTLTTTQGSMDDVIALIKQKSNLQDYKQFEEGLAFFKKDTLSDANFIKNLFYLYSETIQKSISLSSIEDESKDSISRAYSTIINSTMQNIEAISTLSKFLNNGNNIIDVQKISYIILGYVIDTIKRINNTKY